jgi:hypothetical protein
MIRWTRTRGLSIKKFLSLEREAVGGGFDERGEGRGVT